MLNEDFINSTIVPSGVTLRECTVIILGVKCSFCRKCFKCKTDLNIHYKLIHKYDAKLHEVIPNKWQTIGTEIDRCEQSRLNLEGDTGKNDEIRSQKKLRLTLRIGDEVVARKSVKRKHLNCQKIKATARREAHRGYELIAGEDSYEDCIDPRAYYDSPCQCCDSYICERKSSNRYSVSNNVATKRALREESVAAVENDDSRGAKESREVSCTHEDCGTSCYFPRQATTFRGTTLTVAGSKTMPRVYSNGISMSHDSFVTYELNNNRTESSSNTLNNGANKPSKQIVQFANNMGEKAKDINGNDNVGLINAPNLLIVPVILPLHVPDKNTATAEETTVELLIQSTPLYLHFQQNQQQAAERRRKQHQETQKSQEQKQDFQGKQVPNQRREQLQQERLQAEQKAPRQEERGQQRLGRTSSICTEDNSDDIQEVLIIGGRQSAELNHESPTRLEQEKLFYTAIEETMEKQASPSRTKNSLDSAKGKKAVNDDASEQCAKEKKRRIVMNPNEEKLSSAKSIASYRDTVKTCAPNNGKENLMHNENIDVSAELLHRGINYCDEVPEINNTGCVQSPLSHFRVSSFKGTENVPILIDLVNDE